MPNATTGVGMGSPVQSTSKPAPDITSAVSRANSSDLCRASCPTITRPPEWPLAASQAANPAAAWVTTTRFMQAGPGPMGPRRPAVPNSSGPANAAASSASAGSRMVWSLAWARTISSSSLPAVSGSGSVSRQACARSSSSVIYSSPTIPA